MTLSDLLLTIPGRFPRNHILIATAVRCVGATLPDGLETTVDDARRLLRCNVPVKPGYCDSTWATYCSRFRRALDLPKAAGVSRRPVPTLDDELAEFRRVLPRWPRLAAFIEPALAGVGGG